MSIIIKTTNELMATVSTLTAELLALSQAQLVKYEKYQGHGGVGMKESLDDGMARERKFQEVRNARDALDAFEEKHQERANDEEFQYLMASLITARTAVREARVVMMKAAMTGQPLPFLNRP